MRAGIESSKMLTTLLGTFTLSQSEARWPSSSESRRVCSGGYRTMKDSALYCRTSGTSLTSGTRRP